MTIRTHAHARAGLVGNPSDGYFGKTISFIIRNFRAQVTLTESDHFEILPGPDDACHFGSVHEFLREQKLFGYYGGQRLIKSAIKCFHSYWHKQNNPLPDRKFTIGFDTDIPRLVGLSGSSAIIVATLRALMKFYDRAIPLQELPALTLSCEKDELGISAGLQDRVIQNYEGIVYMDFDKSLIESRGFGEYIPLTPATMPKLYVAYDPERAEISDVPHRNLRKLFDEGDKTVVNAMKKYRDLTDRGRDALMKSDWDALGNVMNDNFDLRRTFMEIAPENLRMVEVARSTGASAKFAGSGGAICGLYRDESHYKQLVKTLGEIRCTVLKPRIFE
jgi:glucuronokinase